MDSGVKVQDGNNISPIMILPEEAMREIYNYLSFQTLYFSLRMVCKNIQTYVDDYLKVRGTSFFVSCQRGLGKELIEITKTPKTGFILLRSPASTIPWVTCQLQNNKILDEHPDQDRLLDIVFYAEKYQTGVCHLYISERSSTFRYYLKSEMWGIVLENRTPLKWLEHKGTSHEFVQILVSKINPYHFQFRSAQYTHGYPFVLVMSTDKILRVGKVMFTPLNS